MSLGSGFRWNTFGALVGQGASFARLLLVVAAAGPAIAGKFAIAAAIAGGAGILTEVGFRQQFIATPLATAAQDASHKLSVAWTLNVSLRIVVAGAVLLLIAGNSFIDFAAKDTMLAALGLAAANALASMTNPKLLEQERIGNFRPNALCESAGQLVGLALVIACAHRDASLGLLVVSQITASLAQVAASYLLVPRRALTAVGFSELMLMARQGRPYTVIAATSYATYGLDKIVLGLVASTPAVGAYYMAQRIAEVPAFAFAAVVGRTVLPAYLKAEHAGPGALLDHVRSFTRAYFALFVPGYLIALAIMHADWFAALTHNWPKAWDMLSLLLAAAIFRLGCQLLSPAMVVRNDVAVDARFKIQEAAVYVPLLILSAWHSGATGAAICAILVYVVSWWRRYRFVARYQAIPQS